MRQYNPKQAISIMKPRSTMKPQSTRVASQHHQLLAQGEIFRHQYKSRLKQSAK
jgi:hypothetical protein